MHSYDPIAILKALRDLIFGIPGGKTATSTLIGQIHQTAADVAQTAPYYLINLFAKYAVFAFLFSIAMLIVIVLYAYRYNATKDRMIKKIVPQGSEAGGDMAATEAENPKWKLVQEHINSDDPNKWKLAILESDIILADLLDSLQLPGDGVGEKLKAVEKSDFNTIEDAWEAHKIRNAIAHEGSDFLINAREAKRVIGLYENVFTEFEII